MSGSASFRSGSTPAIGTQQQGGAAGRNLFETPPELLCPITRDLLTDPVLTTSGQVYERAAIETHLARAAAAGAPLTDPLTNAPLDSDQLLPVFPMRSRAAEYRESTVRACASIAASEPRRSEAVRYLRRAAELALPPAQRQAPGHAPKRAGGRKGAAAEADAGGEGLLLSAPGLSMELARFVASHRGEAYSAVALKWFGNELMRGGFPDQAADVFYSLLLEECDRQQQADYLSLCLECWGHTAAHQGTAAAPLDKLGAGGGSGGGSGGAAQPQAVEADSAIVSKLADFVERQRCLSAGDVIDMLQAPDALGRAGALRLCDALLSRAAAATAAGGAGGGSGSDSRRGSQADGGTQGQSELGRSVELLVRYARLSSAEAAESALLALRPQQGEQQAPAAAKVGDDSGTRRRFGGERAQRVRAALSSGPARAAASAVLAVASLAGGGGVAVRVARLLPLLMLLHTSGRPSA